VSTTIYHLNKGIPWSRVKANVANQCHELTNESSRKWTFLGANTLENESSREQKFQSHFTPVSDRAGELKGQGAKVVGANWPGSYLFIYLFKWNLYTGYTK